MQGLVAPYAGAWIETMRGLPSIHDKTVAPYAGAWIETLEIEYHFENQKVAPYAGAWIETKYMTNQKKFGKSRSLRGSVD